MEALFWSKTNGNTGVLWVVGGRKKSDDGTKTHSVANDDSCIMAILVEHFTCNVPVQSASTKLCHDP
jgi:hypothetical protein